MNEIKELYIDLSLKELFDHDVKKLANEYINNMTKLTKLI